VGELGDEPVGLGRVVDGVDASDGLLGVPGEADLAAGIAGLEQPDELGVAGVVEAFVALGEQPAGTVERVGAAAPMTERVLLDPAAALIELRVRQLDDVE